MADLAGSGCTRNEGKSLAYWLWYCCWESGQTLKAEELGGTALKGNWNNLRAAVIHETISNICVLINQHVLL